MDIKDFDTKHRTFSLNDKLYRYHEYIDKDAKSLHHIMGKMNRVKYNTNIELNKVLMDDREHRALNAFFKDKQNPRDQLIKVFELVKPVLSKGVKEELYTILYECDDEMFYIPELLKWYKQKQKKKEKEKSD